MDVTLCKLCLCHAKCEKPSTTAVTFYGITNMLCDYCAMCMKQSGGSAIGLMGTGYMDVMQGRRAEHIEKGSCAFCVK
jgi:hypothetical protein